MRPAFPAVRDIWRIGTVVLIPMGLAAAQTIDAWSMPDPLAVVFAAGAVLVAYIGGRVNGALSKLEGDGPLSTYDRFRFVAAQALVIRRHGLRNEVRDELDTPDVIKRFEAIVEAEREGVDD